MDRHRSPLRSPAASVVPRSKSNSKVRPPSASAVAGSSEENRAERGLRPRSRSAVPRSRSASKSVVGHPEKDSQDGGDTPSRSSSSASIAAPRSKSASKPRAASPSVGDPSQRNRDGRDTPPHSSSPRSKSTSKIRNASAAAVGDASRSNRDGRDTPPRSSSPRSKSASNIRNASPSAVGEPSKDNRDGDTPLRSSSSASVASQRSKSASRTRSVFAAALGQPSKENFDGLSNPPKVLYPSARTSLSLFPARTAPRSSTAPTDAGGRAKAGRQSAWARSPGRSPLLSSSDRKDIYEASGGSLQSKTELSAGEEEKHQLRILNSRLIQWRFINARAVEVIAAPRRDAQEELVRVWMKNYELRNLVAAKQILIHRQTHRMRVVQILSPQVELLNQWEPHAKRHFEAVATLGRLLGFVCLILPLVKGAQANLVTLHQCIHYAMDTMTGISDTAGVLYHMAENIDTVLNELSKTIQLEIEGFQELVEMLEKIPLSQVPFA